MLRIFMLVLMVSLLGCKTIDSLEGKQKATELSDALTYYGVAWRWAHHKDAWTYHVDSKGVQPDIDLEQYKDFRVTGIDTSERLINPDQTEAFITFEITYYNENRATIQTKKVQQRWWYSDEFRQWYTDAEFPKLD